MSINLLAVPGSTTIAVSGRFDMSVQDFFRDAVIKAVSTDTPVIDVDLTEAQYIDSSALGMLLLLRHKAEGLGKVVRLVSPRSNVKAVLDIANFSKLFSIE